MLINKAKFQTPYAIRRHSSCIISLGVMKMWVGGDLTESSPEGAFFMATWALLAFPS
jgi:hypothetical protein